MKPKTLDFSILDKLELTRKPVGIKFLPYKPEGIQRIQKDLNFCQMFAEAQSSPPFYVQHEDLHCVEPMILGMKDYDPVPLSGMVGEIDDLFDELRANQKIYYLIPRLLRDSVRSIVFSSVDQITFDPDVLVITTDDMDQARTIMRASVYSTGEAWSSKGMPVLACSWMYVYPYLSGEVNYTVSGLSMGMQTLKVLPQGLMIISIPWQKLPMILTNMQKMNWHPTSESIIGEEHKKRFQEILEEIEHKINQ
ncbi:MAG: DUF169 domain-containing protein [Thermoleophilia bacterium]|nr:DUF169 domain-containing protein [Thermoleophilia bacterium]